MNQGAGFGSILTMIDLLRLKARKTDLQDQFLVPADLLGRLFQMSDVSRNLLNGLESIIEVIERQFNLLPIQLHTVQEHFEGLHARLSELVTIKQEVKFHTNPDSVPLEVDLSSVGLALEGMLINALKYTPEGGRIDCYTHQANGYAVLSVLNHVDEVGGIPRDFERLVIEPFIRLHPPVEGMEQVERFGLGLGLSVVNHIASKHGGMFLIQQVRDHVDGVSRQKILAELFLPLAD
jgi:signal transduction histidine kinase